MKILWQLQPFSRNDANKITNTHTTKNLAGYRHDDGNITDAVSRGTT